MWNSSTSLQQTLHSGARLRTSANPHVPLRPGVSSVHVPYFKMVFWKSRGKFLALLTIFHTSTVKTSIFFLPIWPTFQLRKNILCHVTKVSCGMPCNKDLNCNGGHKCAKICHDGSCKSEKEICQLPCLIPRKCGHKCGAPCHEEGKCPESKCKVLVPVTCACGRREEAMLCWKKEGLALQAQATKEKEADSKDKNEDSASSSSSGSNNSLERKRRNQKV